ncbi:protein-export chaperone SecB [bacterium]|nr:protein-export chaperone SecB [bacterium]
MLSSIQTRRHWIRKISFEPRKETIKDSQSQAQLALKIRKCKDHWHATLAVSFGAQDSDNANYQGMIEFEGIFDIHPEFPAEKTEEMVRMNGGAILYGAIREMVLNLSSRSKHGPFELPTIDARMFIKPPAILKESKPKKLTSKKLEG